MAIQSAVRIRRAIFVVRRRKAARSRRYGADLKRAAVEHALRERSRGVAVRATAAALGLAHPVLYKWMRGHHGRFRSVAVKAVNGAAGAPTALRLVTAQGHVVDGLSREDLAWLLQALA